MERQTEPHQAEAVVEVERMEHWKNRAVDAEAELARLRAERDDEAASAGHFKAQRDEAAADAARLRAELAEMPGQETLMCEQAENEWSAYAVTLNQRLEELQAMLEHAERKRDEHRDELDEMLRSRDAIFNRMKAAEARVDRAVTERTAAFESWLVHVHSPALAQRFRREFPAPARTQEASDGDL